MDVASPPYPAPPPGTQELVLVVEDAGTGQVHWLVWGLAGQRGKLLEGETPPRVEADGRTVVLKPGDVIEIAAEGVGTLRNGVVDEAL